MLTNAFEEQLAFHNALRQVVMTHDTQYAKEFDEFFVGFEGSFGNKHVTPRTLTSRFLNNLVCVEGIVTNCSYHLLLFYFAVRFTIALIIKYLFKFRFLGETKTREECALLSSHKSLQRANLHWLDFVQFLSIFYGLSNSGN